MLQKWNRRGSYESNNNMDDDSATDDDEHIRKNRLAHQKFVQFKNAFMFNDDFVENSSLRTSGSTSQYTILRSKSLNIDLDDVGDLCEVCNYREKMGRNRRRPSLNKKAKFQKHEMLVIFYLGLIDFIGFCSMSVMAPFFPREVSFRRIFCTFTGLIMCLPLSVVYFIGSVIKCGVQRGGYG